jgi:hypothetical protein
VLFLHWIKLSAFLLFQQLLMADQKSDYVLLLLAVRGLKGSCFMTPYGLTTHGNLGLYVAMKEALRNHLLTTHGNLRFYVVRKEVLTYGIPTITIKI